jgi:hypothetical protein
LVYLSNVVATTLRLNRKVSYGFSYFGKRRSFKASKLSTIHSFLIPDQHFNEFQQTPHSATPEVLLAFITTRKDGDHSASCAQYHFHCPHEFGVWDADFGIWSETFPQIQTLTQNERFKY